MAQRSTFLPYWPFNASGAVYSSVPINVLIGLVSEMIILDRP